MTRLDDHIARLKARDYPWPIPWEDVEALGRSEDCRTSAYRCIAGKLTIAWGETEGVTADMKWTLDQCDARFLQQVIRYARKVEALLTVPANENQLGAMVRFSYNIGLTELAGSTVLRKHNASDFASAARAFALWNKFTDPATKVLTVSDALSARRAVEAARYLTPVDDVPMARMPQAVNPESRIAVSPIAQGGAITAIAGAATGATGLAEQVDSANGILTKLNGIASEVANFIGLPPKVLLAAVLIWAGITVWRWRQKQRDGGWA